MRNPLGYGRLPRSGAQRFAGPLGCQQSTLELVDSGIELRREMG